MFNIEPDSSERSSDGWIELDEPEWTDKELMDDARPGRRKSAKETEGGENWDRVKKSCHAVESPRAHLEAAGQGKKREAAADHKACFASQRRLPDSAVLDACQIGSIITQDEEREYRSE